MDRLATRWMGHRHLFLSLVISYLQHCLFVVPSGAIFGGELSPQRGSRVAIIGDSDANVNSLWPWPSNDYHVNQDENEKKRLPPSPPSSFDTSQQDVGTVAVKSASKTNITRDVLTVEESEEATLELNCPILLTRMGEKKTNREDDDDGLFSSSLVQWSFNSIPLHELPEDTRRLLVDGGRTLRIEDLNHDLDSGLYECTAHTFIPPTEMRKDKLAMAPKIMKAAVQLNVRAIAPRFRNAAYREWKVVRNSRIDMDCDVDAAPPAVIRWVDANDHPIPLVGNKVELLAGAGEKWTLRIQDAQITDSGVYYCNVSNKYGINRAENLVEVFQPTYFLRVPDTRRHLLDAGGPFDLECVAKGDPRLHVHYEWTRNGRPISASLISSTPDGGSRLFIPSLRGRHSGRIECAARTEVDSRVASAVELLVKDVPEPPELLEIRCLTDAGRGPMQALVVWRRPEEHGSPLTHFTLEQRLAFPDERKWEVVHEERPLNEHDPRQIYKVLVPLSPWGNYSYRLNAHNHYGSSDYTYYYHSGTAATAADKRHTLASGSTSEKKSEHGESTSPATACSTPTDVPYSNPKDVRMGGTEPDNLVVEWQPMRRREWNAPSLRYLIRYRHYVESSPEKDGGDEPPTAKAAQASPEKWHEFIVDDPLANSTTVRDQPTFVPYEVQVWAVNSQGYSAVPPLTYHGHSGEAPPTTAPTAFQVVKHWNHSSVSVEWDAVEPASLRGHFVGYRLVYWRTEWPYHTHEINVGNASSIAELGGLEAIRNYTAKVAAVNSRYEGPWSELLTFQTKEGLPTRVHDLRVWAVGAKSVFATWEPPLQTNGNLRGYYLTFENSTSGLIEETFVFHRQLHYLHEALEPDSPYVVSVWAETNGGEGPRTHRHVKTHQLRAPDPPTQFVVADVSPTNATLRWEPFANRSSSLAAPSSIFTGTTFHVKYARVESNLDGGYTDDDGSVVQVGKVNEKVNSTRGGDSGGEKKRRRWWHRSPKITLPETKLHLFNLEPDTDYILMAVVEEAATGLTAELSTPAHVREFRTPSPRSQLSLTQAPSSLVQRLSISGDRVREAAWFIAVLGALAFTLLAIAAMCYWAQRRELHHLYAAYTDSDQPPPDGGDDGEGGNKSDGGGEGGKNFFELKNGAGGGVAVASKNTKKKANVLNGSGGGGTTGSMVDFLRGEGKEHSRFLRDAVRKLAARQGRLGGIRRRFFTTTSSSSAFPSDEVAAALGNGKRAVFKVATETSIVKQHEWDEAIVEGEDGKDSAVVVRL